MTTLTPKTHTPATNAAETAAIVALLVSERGGRFERDDAEVQARRFSLGQVEDAIANADVREAQGTLQNRRGYILAALRGRYPLLPEVQRQRDRERQQQDKRREYRSVALERLGRIVERHAADGRVLEALGGLERIVDDRVLTATEILGIDDDRELWRRLCDRARQRAATRR